MTGQDALPGWFRALTDARVVAAAPGHASIVCHDSRRVVAGAVFVAIPGFTVDGHAYIPKAVASGAQAILVQEELRERWDEHLPEGVCVVAVPDTRVALAEAAAGFYRHPARALGTIGVTGTDGKTTTTHLIAHVLRATGWPAGYLSSVEFSAGGTAELNASHMTTVEADDVQRRLAMIRDAGDRYAVLEASSIGLDLHRVDQCEFDAGVFTNLSDDHLDYHGTMEAYLTSKAILFRMVGSSANKGIPKAAVLNADDPASERLLAGISVPLLTYGLRTEADFMARDITVSSEGTSFRATRQGSEAAGRTRLLGEYNVANCLAAVAVACSQGIEFEEAVAALESFPGVPGRMERIDCGQPFRVVVDIASTEQAMRSVLGILRPLTEGRLIVVFGAAGERDTGRRAGIARPVAGIADLAVITNEDPRSEDPEAILDEIAGALVERGFSGRYEAIVDRRTAVGRVFELARPGDTVLLAGKGTEQSLVIGTTHHPWDERIVARELLEAMGYNASS